jgi:hypothetical protein
MCKNAGPKPCPLPASLSNIMCKNAGPKPCPLPAALATSCVKMLGQNYALYQPSQHHVQKCWAKTMPFTSLSIMWKNVGPNAPML